MCALLTTQFFLKQLIEIHTMINLEYKMDVEKCPNENNITFISMTLLIKHLRLFKRMSCLYLYIFQLHFFASILNIAYIK